MKYLAIIVLLLRPCVTDTDDHQAIDDITLEYHEVVEVESTDLSIKFESVISDSRCPLDVVCVWEGESTIQFELDNGSDIVMIQLSSHPSFTIPNKIDTLGYVFDLRTVAPYPREQEMPLQNSDYIVTLHVSG